MDSIPPKLSVLLSREYTVLYFHKLVYYRFFVALVFNDSGW
jgi:hypothetical protein